jgi:hypothetical protein
MKVAWPAKTMCVAAVFMVIVSNACRPSARVVTRTGPVENVIDGGTDASVGQNTDSSDAADGGSSFDAGDAGIDGDGGAPQDGGLASDAGDTNIGDAGETGGTTDGGSGDSGVNEDDAGVVSDAGPFDSGDNSDGGASDAGSTVEASLTSSTAHLEFIQQADAGEFCSSLVPDTDRVYDVVDVSITGVDQCIPIIDADQHLAIAVNDHVAGTRYLFFDLIAKLQIGDERFGVQQRLVSEPRGFSGTIQDVTGLAVTRYDEQGHVVATVAFPGDAGTLFAPALATDGGYAVVRGDSILDGGWTELLTRVQPDWTVTDGVAFQASSTGSMPLVLLAASDYGGNILVLTGEKTQPAPCPNIWLHPDASVIGCASTSYALDYTQALFGFVGTVEALFPEVYPPDYYYPWQDPEAPPGSSPRTYLSGWSIIRHGLAYGSWGQFCGENGCYGDPDMIWLDSAGAGDLSARACGKIVLPPMGAYQFATSRDGSIVQAAGCKMRVWLGVVP